MKYRNHEIVAVAVGLTGWRAFMDQHDVTAGALLRTHEAAIDHARSAVDEHWRLWEAGQARGAAAVNGGRPALRVVSDCDPSQVERMNSGIGSVSEQEGWE